MRNAPRGCWRTRSSEYISRSARYTPYSATVMCPSCFLSSSTQPGSVWLVGGGAQYSSSASGQTSEPHLTSQDVASLTKRWCQR